MRIGPIESVTVCTADANECVVSYCSQLGFSVRSQGIFTSDDALSGLAPMILGKSWVDLEAPDAGLGSIRIIEGEYPRPSTFRSLGWAALEILVENVDEFVRQLDGSDFKLMIGPAAVGSTHLLKAAQFVGPAGEGVYLTEIHGDPPGFSLPRSRKRTGGVFIAVLAAADLEASRDYLEDNFEVSRVTDHPLPVRVLNKAFGLDPSTLHRISTLQLDGHCAIETDQYPTSADDRSVNDGNLPGGIAVVTVRSQGKPSMRFHRLPGGALLEILPSVKTQTF
jgi:hypothetical protein